MKTKLITIFIYILFVGNVWADNLIKVGWIGPLSGEAAVLGVDSLEVARSVIDDFNKAGGLKGYKIQFLAEDDQYQTAKTILAYKKLVNLDGVKVIFVLTYGGILALADQAQRDNVILIDTLDCDDEIAALPANIFCVTKKTEDLAIQGALHAIKHNNSPVAILYFDGDPFMPKLAKVTKQVLENHGLDVVLFEGAAGKTIDFKSLLLKAKQKKVGSIFFYGYDDFGLGMKQARELGINAKFYANGVAASPGFKASAAGALEGTYIAGWFAPKSEAYASFLESYKKKMGRAPFLEVVTIPTHDVTRILVSGIDSVMTDNQQSFGVDKMREYLYSVKKYSGLSGTITIDSDGTSRSFVVKQYIFSSDQFTEVD